MKCKWSFWILGLGIICFCFFPAKTKDVALPRHLLCGDSLRARISMPSDWHKSNSYPIGYNYALLLEFNKAQHSEWEISPLEDQTNPWDSLLEEKIDLLIINTLQDTIPQAYQDQVIGCYPIGPYQWFVRKSSKNLWNATNFWLGGFEKSKSFQTMTHQFFRSYDLQKFLTRSSHIAAVSPYDELIKKHASTLDWDWRLLAALIYKESRFSIWAESSFGAVGLMQVKPTTAAHYEIYNVYDPDLNIQAGVAHLDYLQRIYRQEGMDSLNIIKFTLAAYNAGEGRIEDCMNFTLSQGKDYRKWTEVKKMIPLMSDPEHYEGDVIKLGKFRGTQTLDYVTSVLEIYQDYCSVISE